MATKLIILFSVTNLIITSFSAIIRLPTHILPLEYSITIEPNIANTTFTGSENILLNITEETTIVTLNIDRLKLLEEATTLINPTNTTNKPITTTYDETNQFVIFTFQEAIFGTVTLHLVFNGVFGEDTLGFYKASYTDRNGEAKSFAMTMFAASFARRAFPCFDEPNFKSKFTLSVIRKTSHGAISNGKLITTTELDSGRYMDTFEQTVPMSTYLVAYVVSDYTSVDLGSHSVYGRSELIDSGKALYPLQAGYVLLMILEDFIGMPYSLNKMYQVAINDSYFTFGAMENWGLVTYRERFMSYDVTTTTSYDELRMVKIIAHEFAHQWFGNLVTPTWWSNIWLNEGFATYFEYHATAIYKPTWRMDEQYLVRVVQTAMEYDSKQTTRAMTSEPESIENLMGIFDTIAYEKAGSVIRMLEHVVTTEVFKSALNIYVQDRQFSNAEPSHLWSAFQEAFTKTDLPISLINNQTIEELMTLWTSQSGIPVVTAVRNYQTGSVTITQKRFLLESNDEINEEIWPIPINYAYNKSNFLDTSVKFWLTKNETVHTEANLKADDWLIFNIQQTGYYRVNYDETNWDLIIGQLKTNLEEIHVLNRAQIISDAFALAKSGQLNYTILFDLLGYVSEETDFIPLYPLNEGLKHLNRVLSGSTYFSKFQTFIISILKPAYNKFGVNLIAKESITDIFAREIILQWLCLYGDDNCQNDLSNKLAQHQDWIEPDLRASIYCGGMRRGTIEDWNYLYNKYSAEGIEELEKNRLITALGCSLDETILERTINVALGLVEGYTIRTYDVSTVLSSVITGSNIGTTVAFNYLRNNFQNLTQQLDSTKVSTIMVGLSTYLTTSEHQTQFETFVESLSDEHKVTYNNSIDVVRVNLQENLDWLEKSSSTIEIWLDSLEEEDSEGDGANVANLSALLFLTSVVLFVLG